MQRKLVDGLRYLIREELKLSQSHASDGWLTQDALWLISKTTCDRLRAHLLSQGTDGIPEQNVTMFNVLQDHGIVLAAPNGKAIWRGTVVSDSGWSHSFTFLRLAPALIWEMDEQSRVQSTSRNARSQRARRWLVPMAQAMNALSETRLALGARVNPIDGSRTVLIENFRTTGGWSHCLSLTTCVNASQILRVRNPRWNGGSCALPVQAGHHLRMRKLREPDCPWKRKLDPPKLSPAASNPLTAATTIWRHLMHQDSTTPAKGYLDSDQAGAHLSLSPRTLEKLRTIGGGPRFRKLGRRVVYTRADLDAWANARACESTSDPTYTAAWK